VEKIDNGLREIRLFETSDNPVALTVKTKSPTKWLLIDRETGQIFQGSPKGHWDKLEAIIKEQDVH
jgi:hypothetical protein